MATKSVLPAAWDLPAAFRQRLGDTAGKQRLMQEEGHLLLVLHRPPGPDEEKRAGRYFWRKPDGTWQGCEPGGKSITLASHMAEYNDQLERLDRREDAASTAREYFDVMGAVGPLHRATRHMHAVLQEAREAVPNDRELINLRDRAYELERSFELLHADTQNGLDFAVARRAEEQAASSQRMAISAHRLNLLAAFFFPLATLSAVLGVNMQHGYEQLPGPMPFLTMVGIGLAGGLVLMVFVSMTRPQN